MRKILAFLGARLWENHGYWINKECNIVQMDYNELPLLGKIGFNLMIFGLKNDENFIRQMESFNKN